MPYSTHYNSPLGPMTITCDGGALTGLRFDGQKYSPPALDGAQHDTGQDPAPVLAQAIRWLDAYFAGKEPDFTPPLRPVGSAFQQAVWQELLAIPYGQTTSYGAIATRIAARRGVARMSAQAVGGAVGHNPIGLIIPCHRVVGSNGSLTGYAAGLDRKRALLALEGLDLSAFFTPRNSTAP